MSSFPPRHLCIASALMIAGGIGSVVQMIAELMRGQFHVAIGFVGIPIGYGVLTGRPSSRNWALLLAGAGLVLIAGVGGLGVYAHYWTGSDRTSHPEQVSIAAALLLAAASSAYLLAVLTRRENQGWFAEDKGDSPQARSFAWSVAVVATVLFSSQQMVQWWIRETFESAVPFHVRLAPYDAATGEGLIGISYHGPSSKPVPGSKMELPKLNVSYSSAGNGILIDIFGMAVRPFEVKLGYPGYEDKTVTLGEKLKPWEQPKSELRVPLDPVEPGTPKGE